MPAAESQPPSPSLDLATPTRIHIVGVGGAAMSAIATVLAAMGHRVSGSDLKASSRLDSLRALGVEVHIGHSADRIGDAQVVARSTAIPDTNPEVVAARGRSVPVVSRADVMAALAASRRTVAVAGTKGKTTTTSMLALIMVEAGFHPSFIVGGSLNEAGTSAVWDSGDWFVVEADESDGTFIELGAEAVIVTNVEPDHLDFYGTQDALVAAFDRFVMAAGGQRLVCADDVAAAALAGRTGAATYGVSPDADWRLGDIVPGRAGIAFSVSHRGRAVASLNLAVPGIHNARNAVAALAMAVSLGAPAQAAVRALERFGGVARRYQFRGEAAGVSFIDDYAHLPTAAAAVLATARDGGWKRVIAVFQPHRYSRTAALWRSFADAFVDADLLVVTDVYPEGEAARPGVSGKLIVDAVLDAHPTARVAWMPARSEVISYLSTRLRPGDVCLTLGAGDITSLPDDLIRALRHPGPDRPR